MGKHYDALKTQLGELADINHAAAVLGWDQETYMPAGAANARAQQLGTLSRLSHSTFTSKATGRMIKAAAAEVKGKKRPARAAIIRLAREDYKRARKLPSDFVAEMTRTASHATHAWVAARKANDFAQFAPWLQKNVALARRAAEYMGYSDHPYDALLDQFEPGMKTATVQAIFKDLRERTVPLVKKIVANKHKVSDKLIRRHFDKAAQEALGKFAAEKFGYDFTRGRIDYTNHPFCTTFAIDDVRITTRIDEKFFNSYFYSILHEVGHALYEQGIDKAWDRTPVEGGTSLGMHESQSRMWENLVGRSPEYWQFMWPHLIKHFPQLKGADRHVFYKAVNKSEPSLIRVEADEVTYNLHIMVRLEMEVGMIDGSIKIKDVPELWNAKYKDYLGITPPNDADGCLQDIHWTGLLGYFSTYALGNIMSAQLFAAAEKANPGLRAGFAKGEFAPLLVWLRKNVHRHGRSLKPMELIKKATGQALTAEPYVNYLTQKYSAIYEL